MKLFWMGLAFFTALFLCSGLQKAVYASKLQGWVKEAVNGLIGLSTVIGIVIGFAFVFGDKNPPRPTSTYYDHSADPIETLEQEQQECWDKQGNYEC